MVRSIDVVRLDRPIYDMTYDEVMSQLKALSNDMIRKHNAKAGVGDNQFGVKMGDIRNLGKLIKPNPELAAQLWASNNLDAMMLATLIMKPKLLTIGEIEQMLAHISYFQITDIFGTNVVKMHPDKESVREKWMDSTNVMIRRMGWSLTTERVIKDPSGIDLRGLLNRIEAEMGTAPRDAQWTMNFCLAEIGIRNPDLRARAIAIGEKIGAFRDYPVSKGCTSPYAPIWIEAIASRQA